jgi:hypothetical protein
MLSLHDQRRSFGAPLRYGDLQAQSPAHPDLGALSERDDRHDGLMRHVQHRLNTAGLLARAAIAVFAVLAGLAFWQVSGTINAEPPATPFPGWVAVLQPKLKVSGTQVQLEVHPLQPGKASNRPWLSYSVAACGVEPFRGTLLLGGAARLSDIRMLGPTGTSLASVSDAEIFDASGNESIPLGTVQALRFTLAPTRCVAHFSPGSAPPEFAGTAIDITGRAGSAVVLNGKFGPWTGPRSAQRWPLVGSLPGVSPEDLGEWKIAGLPGSWSRTFHEYIRLDAGSLSTVGSVEAARPSLLDLTRLSWSSSSPFQASARVLNANALSTWQNWLVAATIVLTLAGSLLAATLFDLIPPLRNSKGLLAPANAVGAMSHYERPPLAASERDALAGRHPKWMVAAFALGTLCAWVLTRRRSTR